MTQDVVVAPDPLTQETVARKRRLRVDYNAPVVLTFVLLCLLALGLSTITGGSSNRLLFSVYRSSWTDPLTYVRFFGHAIGHANWQHLLGNLMLLLVVGPPLEERYGHWRMILLMAITALVSGLVQFLFFPGTSLLGASGIVFMMIVLASMAGMRAGYIPITMIAVILLYLGSEIWQMITVDSNVSHLTHIIGGITGAVCGFMMNRHGREDVVEPGLIGAGAAPAALPAGQTPEVIGVSAWTPSGMPIPAQVTYPEPRPSAVVKPVAKAAAAPAPAVKAELSESDMELLKRLEGK